MNIPLVDTAKFSTEKLETISRYLLEQGMEYLRQERYIEGMALLSLAGEHLSSDQEHLASSLLALKREYGEYALLQQSLQEVSQRFAQVHAELKASIERFCSAQALPVITPGWEQARYINDLLASSKPEPRPAHKSLVEKHQEAPSLYAVCFGPFEVRRYGTPIALCANRNGQAILRYLVAQPDGSATTDTLMALLWPEDMMEVALHKLYVTISILRRSLQQGQETQMKYILYKHGTYQLNPALALHSDVEDFLHLYQAGRKAGGRMAAGYYEKACTLYKRPFLMEDLYANWSFARREQLRQIHLDVCNFLAAHYLELRAFETAAHWASVILEENRCDEIAHQQLMRIYALQGRRNDALRQYSLCQQALRDDLNLRPTAETVNLRQAIVRGELY